MLNKKGAGMEEILQYVLWIIFAVIAILAVTFLVKKFSG
jgi:hypothetical protein